MPLSHQHNKALYSSPTIAKALSLSSFSILPGGELLENRVTQQNACTDQCEREVGD